FVPPYILEAVAKSTDVEESRVACQNTLKHTTANAQHRREVCTKAHVQLLSPTEFARQIYDCQGSDTLPGTLVRSEGETGVKDRQVNNTYEGFGIVRNFFQQVFGRNSLDDNGLALLGSESPEGYNNAFWNGNINQMVFGDGDHIAFDYLTDSLDVIGHELSHGFVQYSSPLDYYKQSGALNESCADIFGFMAEQWHTKQTCDKADWDLGQTLFPVAFTGSALRTLKAGKAYTNDPVFGTDPQPKHMDNLYTGNSDGGGVHINSGSPNHAFYLAAKALGGYSWEKAAKVWYKTMTSGRIPVDCDFATFAAVAVDVAGAGVRGDGG
ncbi:peptidase M4 thermolysin, partial [Decorospora gaudefroyi]